MDSQGRYWCVTFSPSWACNHQNISKHLFIWLLCYLTLPYSDFYVTKSAYMELLHVKVLSKGVKMLHRKTVCPLLDFPLWLGDSRCLLQTKGEPDVEGTHASHDDLPWRRREEELTLYISCIYKKVHRICAVCWIWGEQCPACELPRTFLKYTLLKYLFSSNTYSLFNNILTGNMEATSTLL